MNDSDPQLVKISELARLSGVPSPTIKHYMREGLLPGPARRTSRNMAYYDARLADRVRAIKDLQQTHFLPLKLIGEVLEPAPSPDVRADLDDAMRARLAGIAPAIEDGIAVSRKRRAGARKSAARKARSKVLETMNIAEKELALLAELGLALPTEPAKGEPYYAGPDLDIIEVIDETREKGLGDLFPMEILEPYAACVRTLVRMELELFRQRVLAGASLPDVPLPDVTRDATELAERLICAMRNKLVIPELSNLAGAGEASPKKGGGKSKAKKAASKKAAPKKKATRGKSRAKK